MRRKLSRYGNNLALDIDKPILELLNITDSTELEITTDGESIIIAPIHKDKNIEENIKKNSKKYASVLKKLAKS
ncbi:hypothetical protein KAT92_02315 [Candidatus Babeliales bacterium]|nr:hypothetical protein [Candidatus Babeliales bacterium]